MPTRIIEAGQAAPTNVGSTWGDIGSGLQGVAAIAGAAMQANAAHKAAEAAKAADAARQLGATSQIGGTPGQLNIGGYAVNLPSLPSRGAGSGNLGMAPSRMSAPMAPDISKIDLSTPDLGPGAGDWNNYNTSESAVNALGRALPFRGNLSQMTAALPEPPMSGGGGAGFQSIFAQRFPGLFPQSAMQYGGL